jgi:aminoglycoside 6'-N-acetyltransferase I
MRRTLWPECADEEHYREIDEVLSERPDSVFIAENASGGLCGLLEASIRPWADGCDTRPVGYLEGWYVDPDARSCGVGRALVAAAEKWVKAQGCCQMASDAELSNNVSREAHTALGYEETERVVRYKKNLS